MVDDWQVIKTLAYVNKQGLRKEPIEDLTDNSQV